jgi:hypothetical protein
MAHKPVMTPEAARQDHRDMLRFMALNAAAGVTIGLSIAAAILLLDLGGVGTLVAHSRDPIIAIILIAVPMALVFGGSVTASAIWMMPYESKFAPERRKDDDDQEDTDR